MNGTTATRQHWIEQTGEVVYCVEHAAENPHGDTYVATSPESVLSASMLSGLNSILMYGYEEFAVLELYPDFELDTDDEH